jgi:hypothetical protein
MTFVATDIGNDFSFDDCGLSEGFTMSGTGSYDWENDIFTLDIDAAGCAYTYERSGEEYSHTQEC